MAYSLGYVWADGWIQLHRGKYLTLGLKCSAKDRELIDSFKIRVGSHHKTREIPACESQGRNHKPQVSLSISGTEFCQPLVHQHGVIPGKCHFDPSCPEVPDEYLASFVRGYFDGDGSISIIRERYGMFRLYGTYQFTLDLKNRIESLLSLKKHDLYKTEETTYRATWSDSSDLRSLYSWLYRGQGPFLSRKHSVLHKLLRD